MGFLSKFSGNRCFMEGCVYDKHQSNNISQSLEVMSNIIIDNTTKVRKEVHTRSKYAALQADIYFIRMKNIRESGNLLTSKYTHKFLQARRIYIHYMNEYQKCQCLPLSK